MRTSVSAVVIGIALAQPGAFAFAGDTILITASKYQVDDDINKVADCTAAGRETCQGKTYCSFACNQNICGNVGPANNSDKKCVTGWGCGTHSGINTKPAGQSVIIDCSK
jgi:hypothetical protein